MSEVVARDLTLTTAAVDCCVCGIVYWVPNGWDKERHRLHDTFYCPNGHGQHYLGKTADQKRIEALEGQLRCAESNRSYWHGEAERKTRSLRATKGVLTKTRKRIAAGVCPCCHRSFQQLADHMKTKHPEFPADAPAE